MDETKATKSRRDFLFIATGAVAAIGVAAVAKPIVGQWSPAGDTVAKYGVDVDLSKLQEGEQMTVSVVGRPVAIRYRTPEEIAKALADDQVEMIDPETDRSRLRPKPDGLFDPRFLVFEPICTHFGCMPVSEQGDYDGWLCPCHGAHFDTSGRSRKGPAPTNMAIPPYKWVSDSVISIAYLNPS